MRGERTASEVPKEGGGESFNPHDPKYKKVEDIPEVIRDKFIDLPEGGFVRKEAAEYDRDLRGRAEWNIQKNEGFIDWLFKGRAIVREKAGIAREEAEDNPVREIAESATFLLRDQLVVEAWNKMKEALAKKNMEGHVWQRVWRDGQRISGEINGQKIDLIREAYRGGWDILGHLNNANLSVTEVNALWKELDGIGIDRLGIERLVIKFKEQEQTRLDELYKKDPTMSRKARIQEEEERREVLSAQKKKEHEVAVKAGFEKLGLEPPEKRKE